MKLDAETIKSIAIAAVVILSGGGLWQGKINEKDIEQGITEIHEMRSRFDEAMGRQERLEQMLQKLTK